MPPLGFTENIEALGQARVRGAFRGLLTAGAVVLRHAVAMFHAGRVRIHTGRQRRRNGSYRQR